MMPFNSLKIIYDMATKGFIKWYDLFSLALPINVIIVANDWKFYHCCNYPLNIWMVVHYITVFVYRLLMFVDRGIAAGMKLDLRGQQRYARFCGRVAVLSILSLLVYPFLWGWTVIGTVWLTKSKDCLYKGQEWYLGVWLIFCYVELVSAPIVLLLTWLERRLALMLRAQRGIPISWFGVLVDIIRVPGWAFEAAEQLMRGMGQDVVANPRGRYLTAALQEALKTLVQELPKFRVKYVPNDCSECVICLEELLVGEEIRVLPCAHSFHVECIDGWLQLNLKCPRCLCCILCKL